ncbi:MAG: TasA family protein [bacterium]|nr:TasA family protein [bacterium]
MKKILLSLSMIVFVGAVVIGATGAFFSDTETSTGNTFTAGAIDLGVDNTSYYNGHLNQGTTWQIDWDLSEGIPHQFFNFNDLKPGG